MRTTVAGAAERAGSWRARKMRPGGMGMMLIGSIHSSGRCVALRDETGIWNLGVGLGRRGGRTGHLKTRRTRWLSTPVSLRVQPWDA